MKRVRSLGIYGFGSSSLGLRDLSPDLGDLVLGLGAFFVTTLIES